MRCPYQILSVDRQVHSEDLKKAYRSLLLKFHPDKRIDVDKEEATKHFLEIQKAYELLSDPQERAWFDSHREEILGNGPQGKNTVDIFRYYSSFCYEGYDDGPSNLFYTIAQEDKFFKSSVNYPSFGDSSSNPEFCATFYNFWTRYSTTRSFSHLDKYDLRQAPNRTVRRFMEKENSKLRAATKKEYNEAVRSLVLFVKRRDRRLSEPTRRSNQQNKKSVSSVHKIPKKTFDQPEGSWLPHLWVLDDPEPFSSDEAEKVTDSFFCVVCDKLFSSSKTFTQHTRSKAHSKRHAQLRQDLLSDERLCQSEQKIPALLREENKMKEVEFIKRKSKKKSLPEAENYGVESELEHYLTLSDSYVAKISKKRQKPHLIGSVELVSEENGNRKDITKDFRSESKEEAKEVNKADYKVIICNTCGSTFESRNKLFHHLKNENHTFKVESKPNKKK
ncbi:dnaJ homolog subfamily C member 21-like isoform X4 [Zophobas morio]|uniref:dnaJ homolog subfamily C member 21-like isoform X4 n=1 Tax=Zophobas morio TaxID=2755281 RepID=UPI003083BA2C